MASSLKSKAIIRVGGESGIDLPVIPMAVLTFVTFVALQQSSPFVLPVLSIILVCAALLMCLVTWLRHRGEPGIIERMHLAALIMFFGFGAGIMADTEAALRLLAVR